jgi:hypothetical protein
MKTLLILCRHATLSETSKFYVATCQEIRLDTVFVLKLQLMWSTNFSNLSSQHRNSTSCYKLKPLLLPPLLGLRIEIILLQSQLLLLL